MRTLIPALMGLALAMPALPAADQPAGGSSIQTANSKPVNSVCPVCGMKADPAKTMAVTGPAGGPITVAYCGADTCAVQILGKPDLYARAAAADRPAYELQGTASGSAGKDASGGELRDQRYDALDQRSGSSGGMMPMEDGSAGKPAEREEYGPLQQDRANALRFQEPQPTRAQSAETRYWSGGADSGSSSGSMGGLRAQPDPLNQGKAADRRDYGPIDQQRANALYFNRDQLDQDDRREKLEQGRADYRK